MELRSDSSFRFSQPRAEIWDAFTSVGEYQRWWPWLAGFDGTAFGQGEQWFCEVSPPLPYRLNFSVTLTDVVPEKFVRARIGGDIGGWAELSATDAPAKVRRGERVTHGEGTAGSAGSVDYHGSAERAGDRQGCELRLRSALSPQNRVLRLVTLGARPVARFGHDWVLDSGVRQFRRRLDDEA